MVRLRPHSIPRLAVKTSKFPFHNGSIETWLRWGDRKENIRISIPQWFDWDHLVRLYERHFYTYFHSTMVRLRLKESQSPQSHLGLISIPQWFDWDPPSSCSLPCYWTISIPQWFDWDKHIPARPFLQILPDFHSTMVRLRLSLSMQMPYPATWFPFHNGSIETDVNSIVFAPFPQISIPQWFDWDHGRPSIAHCECSRISIPQWFDWDSA